MAEGETAEPAYSLTSTMQSAYVERMPTDFAHGAREALVPGSEDLEAESLAPETDDELEILSGDIVGFEDERYTDRDAPRFTATGARAEQDPWWEMVSASPTIPLMRPSRGQRLRRLASVAMPFGLRERAVPAGTWRVRMLLLGSLAVLVGLTAVASVAAFGVAGHLVRGAPSQLPFAGATPTSQGGVIIQPNAGNRNPTPTMPPYLIGAWASSNTPSGGSVQIFVRVTHADGANASRPAAGVPVRLAVGNGAYGPVRTNSYGIATFTVSYGGGYSGYTPVFVTATAAVGGQTITAQTSFAPH
jgi:hypothetical protein